MKKFMVSVVITMVFYVIAEILGHVVGKEWIVFEAFVLGSLPKCIEYMEEN